MAKALFTALMVLFATVAFSAETKLEGEKEDRARGLFSELRCVVCQNQSIDSSDADVAKDLRAIVREQIANGKSDSQVRSFLVARYGEFILLKPAFSWHTALLWGAPLFLVLAGGLLAWRSMGGRGPAEQPTLSAEEEAALNDVLSEKNRQS